MTTIAVTHLGLRGDARSWRAAWFPGAAVVVVVGLQVVFFTGVIASDDMGYLEPAIHAAGGEAFTPEIVARMDCHCFARFTFWKLMQWSVMLIPGQPWAIALPSLLAAWMSLGAAGVFTHRYIGRQWVPVTLLLCGMIPVFVASASVAVPDMLAGALAWTGVLIAAGALISRNARYALVRCAAGGMLIAAAYNAKEIAAFMVPGVVLFVLLRILSDSLRSGRPATGPSRLEAGSTGDPESAPRRGWNGWMWGRGAALLAGVGVGLGMEMLVLWRWTGNPLFHFDAVVISQRAYTPPPIYPSPGGYLMYWTDYLRWLATPWSDFGLVGPILLGGILFACLKRSAVTGLVLCAVVVPLVYLSVGSTEFQDYRPIVHQPRYLIPLVPGMAILGTAMIGHLWSVRWMPRRAAVALGILLVLGSLVLPNRHAGRWYHADTFAAGYELFQAWAGVPRAGGEVLVSRLSHNRLHGIAYWVDGVRFGVLDAPFPTTPEAWIEQYGGSRVAVTLADRTPPAKSKHATFTLFGPPIQALGAFEVVGRSEPPRDRLALLVARISGRAAPTDPGLAVEVREIPVSRPHGAHHGHE